MGHRRVRAEPDRHLFAGQLPGRQTRALQPGPCLVDVDALDQPFQMRGADDAQRGAETAGGQRAGIAMGQQILWIALIAANQLHTELRHGQVGFAIALVNRDCLGFQRRQRRLARLESPQPLAHLLERPEQVRSGWPGGGQDLEIRFQRCSPVVTFSQPGLQAEHQTVGRADADRRGATHDHGADRLCDLGGGFARMPDLFRRKPALIQQIQPSVTPIDGFHFLRRQQALAHATPSSSDMTLIAASPVHVLAPPLRGPAFTQQKALPYRSERSRSQPLGSVAISSRAALLREMAPG